MKKFIKITISLILVISSFFVVSSCSTNSNMNSPKTSTPITNSNSYNVVNNNDSNSVSQSENDVGGGTISTRKYRVNYYDIPYQFVLIVGEDAYWEWDEQYNNENPDETNIMVMKRFIEHFNIPRELFDKANLEWAKVILNKMGSRPNMNPKDFANQETDEVYNADIIYTFDDEIINEYYISGYYPYIYESEFENAVANGTYQTQTTDWIDIEQMESEIIAKYGEAEIVTETAAIPEETEITS